MIERTTWRDRAEAATGGPLVPDPAPALVASEIGSYAFCFVPMSAGPSRAPSHNRKEWWFLAAGTRMSERGDRTVNYMIHASRSSRLLNALDGPPRS